MGITRRRILSAGGAGAALVAAGRTQASAEAGTARAAHALNRLGYGPRPGQVAEVARDPRGWTLAQLAPDTLPLPADLQARLHDHQFVGQDPMAIVREMLAHAMRAREASRARTAGTAPMLGADLVATPEATALGRFFRQWQQPAYESRVFRALRSPRQLQETMVDFWFNHFNVAQSKTYVRVLAGHYEHYAIRPYALGRFADLLHATARHPAMLHYLDNAVSSGGGAGRGLNENYARELMELHTLGVEGGYTQSDVTALARILTGWTFGPLRDPPVQSEAPPPGDPRAMPGFRFVARMHDAGPKTWLGHEVAPGGMAEGEFALDTLARHPATARHIAFKLAQYFVSDTPPPALVQRLAAVFLQQDGAIVPVLRALFESAEFWDERYAGAKFKTPQHYAFSVLRATDHAPARLQPLLFHLVSEGMPLFDCPTPDGYRNTEGPWLNPHAMGRRIEFALGVARTERGLDPQRLALELGPLATPETRAVALEKREDPALAVALLLAGPGMMRR